MDKCSLADRLQALWDHLGLSAAHVATQVAGDLAAFAAAAPERIAGLVLMTPTRLDGESFAALAQRTLLVSGDAGIVRQTVDAALASLPGASEMVLEDYAPTGWSDVIADHPEPIAEQMIGFLEPFAATAVAPDVPRSGEVAGIHYEIVGRGPALILLPILLAPSQWQPILDDLSQHYSLVVLGGAQLGGVALLEARARTPAYQGLFRTLIDLMAPAADAHILDIGCGAGSLDRLLARRGGARLKITAIDVNPFLLRQAGLLAAADGVGERIDFMAGDATSLDFADAAFDGVFSITVLEECDAARALCEMVRVVKPGGAVAVAVRAIDLPQWWHLALPQALADKVSIPPQSVAEKGIADARLYQAMADAGLENLVPLPSLVSIETPDTPYWRYREDAVLASLTADERQAWASARSAALAAGLLFMAHPMHAAVAWKAA